MSLNKVHPTILKLFPRELLNVPLTGRLKYFQTNWEILTQDDNILSIVKRYKIPFLEEPYQKRCHSTTHMSKDQSKLINLEIMEMLKKGAIQHVNPTEG